MLLILFPGRQRGGWFGRGGGRGNNNNNPTEVFLYNNGDLTPNTKLYDLDNGNSYEVSIHTLTLTVYTKMTTKYVANAVSNPVLSIGFV